MMTTTAIVSIVGLLSVASAMYAGYDLWQKRRSTGSKDIVTSAMQLLQPYEAEVIKLRKELSLANDTITLLNKRVKETEERATSINNQLAVAQQEISFLRVQVKMLREGNIS